MNKLVSLIVPMYNEEEMAPIFYEAVNKVLDEVKDRYDIEYVFVNDGSKDKTWEIIKSLREKDHHIHAVSLSRNSGQEAAIAAGLYVSRGDACIIMDADLQDSPSVLIDMLNKYEEGYDVVNAKRTDRKKDSFLKRFTAARYYDVIYKLSGKIKVPKNVNNFRLLSRKVVDQINALPEKNRVFRILVPYVGYKTAEVTFAREKRPKGESKYNPTALFSLAGESIVASSSRPLLWPLKCGLLLTFLSSIAFIATLVFHILARCAIAPFIFWDTGLYLLISIIVLLFGITFIFLGIIAQYVGKSYLEARNRPLYFIDEELKDE